MGARPIASLDSLRFGPLEDPRHRHLLRGVVDGIGGYGNAVGVATVGGETGFHECYRGNILVNAFNLGLVEADRFWKGSASGIGNPVIYVGSKTGRDGIHGASLLASAEFDDGAEAKRPTVQVGDPFTEKCLIEACLEADAERRARRHPGHGRRRPHLLVLRDGEPCGHGHRDGPRPRAAARVGHDALRAAALGEPGAHAPRHEAGRRRGGARDLRALGPRRGGRRAGDRRRTDARPLARQDRGRDPGGPGRGEGAGARPAGARARRPAGAPQPSTSPAFPPSTIPPERSRRCSTRRTSAPRPGSTASTTSSCRATPCWDRAAMPRSCA